MSCDEIFELILLFILFVPMVHPSPIQLVHDIHSNSISWWEQTVKFMECLYAPLCSVYINNLIVSFKSHFKCNCGMNNLLRSRKTSQTLFSCSWSYKMAGYFCFFVCFKENIFLWVDWYPFGCVEKLMLTKPYMIRGAMGEWEMRWKMLLRE